MKRNYFYFMALFWVIAVPAHSVDIKTSGFVSASATMLDSDEVEYMGINDDLTFDADSVLGVQFDAMIDSQLSATVQLMAKSGHHSGSRNVHAHWAYLNYTPHPNHRVRVGRLSISDFYYSEFVNVSHAYAWIRPPVEVYGNVPITSYDGVQYTNFSNIGDVDFEFSIRVGGFDEDVMLGGAMTNIKSKTYWGVNTKLFYDDLTVRLSYAQPTISMDNPAMEGFFNTVEGMGGADVIKDLRNDEVKIDFYSLAIHYDSLNWLVFSEATLIERDSSPLSEQTSYYVGAGYHIGKWLPTLTFSSREEDARTDLIGDTADPVVMGMVTGFVEGFVAEQETITLSLRWDFHKAAALKFEVQQIKPKSDTSGLFDVIETDYDNDSVMLYGISISSTF